MPSREQVERALSLITRPAEHDYFFDHLTSPGWLVPLAEAGRFQTPPDPIREGEYVRFPGWCESRYLARVAGHAPDAVVKIIKKIPATTNVRVHADYVDAALAMPPASAVKLVAMAKTWAESTYPSLLPEKLGKLIAHLAQGGITNQAIGLARVLLAPQPDPRAADKAEHGFAAEPRARFDVWDYEELLREYIPALVAAAGLPALDMLSDLLENALTLSYGTGPEDLSWIWRSAIEDNAQNHPGGSRVLLGTLVVAVRDAAEKLIPDGIASVENVIAQLETHRWHIFDRIALHILRLFAPTSPTATERLARREFFGAGVYHHEYVLLTEAAFAYLPESMQEQILGWGDDGPDLDPYKARYERETGSPPTEETIAGYVRHWRSRQFNPFRGAISPHLAERHPWLQDLERPSADDAFISVMYTWTGPTSPLTLDELEALPLKDIVEYLKAWAPPGEMMAPSAEGLARVLTEAVARSPERFAAGASAFLSLDSVYVAGLLHGFDKAIEAQRPFPWEPVLQACAGWLASEADHEAMHHLSQTQGPSWVRRVMAWLLERGLNNQAGDMRVPFEHRRLVWAALSVLTNDHDPSAETEAEYGVRQLGQAQSSSWDPPSLALNTVRGMALHALIQYALWVRQHLEAQAGRHRGLRSFAQMREVERVLDRHLSVRNDRSLAVRSVYGQHLPALAHLAPRWVTKNLALIFPPEPQLLPYRDAAWRAYIRYSQPKFALFRILHSQFAQAVRAIGGETRPNSTSLDGAEVRLGQHLLAFTWQGLLPLEADGLLDMFFQRAPDPLRARVLEFVGFSLHRARQENEIVPPDVAERLKALWEWRMSASKSAGHTAAHREELGTFGNWFAFGPFDAEWALGQFMQVLQRGGTIRAIPPVLDHLAETVVQRPLQTLQCLRLMVENDRLYESVGVGEDRLEAILRPGLQSDDLDARQAATTLIHMLGARGSHRIGRLLAETL